MHSLVFLRHGESQGNVEQRPQGHTDQPLTERGRAQAKALAAHWAAEGRGFDLAISSPLLRAAETAEIIASALNLKLEIEPGWIERDVGQLAELDREQVRQQYENPRTKSPYRDAFGVGGEGEWQLYLRAGRALHGLMARPEGAYLVVSHGGMLNALMYSILGLAPQGFLAGPSFHLSNCGFAEFTYEAQGHRWTLRQFNAVRLPKGLDG